MIVSKLKSKLSNYIYNVPGWKTNKKIVVIESDDWGSERTPTKREYDDMLSAGLKVDACPFSKYDTVESNDDLEHLYSVLSNHKGADGKPPVITANFNLANPNYEDIAKNNYECYSYLNYKQTLDKYTNREKVLELINKGIQENIFFPQYHSREHLNPYIWLDELKNGNKSLLIGFKNGVFGLSRATGPDIKKFHLASLLFRNEEEKQLIENSLQDGYNYFENIFKYKPESFIAPVYTWNEINEDQIYKLGINIIQSSYYQNYFTPYNTTDFKRVFKKVGMKNKNNQTFLVRNSVFEPSITPNRNNIDDCLSHVKAAFTMRVPAIISTHRLNYTGGIVENNRIQNVKALDILLKKILKKWPDTVFMNSVELGKLIRNEKSSTAVI